MKLLQPCNTLESITDWNLKVAKKWKTLILMLFNVFQWAAMSPFRKFLKCAKWTYCNHVKHWNPFQHIRMSLNSEKLSFDAIQCVPMVCNEPVLYFRNFENSYFYKIDVKLLGVKQEFKSGIFWYTSYFSLTWYCNEKSTNLSNSIRTYGSNPDMCNFLSMMTHPRWFLFGCVLQENEWDESHENMIIVSEFDLCMDKIL